MRTFCLKTIATLAFMLIATMAFAQGILRGVVTDSLAKDPLVGQTFIWRVRLWETQRIWKGLIELKEYPRERTL